MSDFEFKTNIKITPAEKLKLVNLPESVVTISLHERQVQKKLETAATVLQRGLKPVLKKLSHQKEMNE